MNSNLVALGDIDDDAESAITRRPSFHSIHEDTDYIPHEEVSQWDAVVDAWARSI